MRRLHGNRYTVPRFRSQIPRRKTRRSLAGQKLLPALITGIRASLRAASRVRQRPSSTLPSRVSSQAFFKVRFEGSRHRTCRPCLRNLSSRRRKKWGISPLCLARRGAELTRRRLWRNRETALRRRVSRDSSKTCRLLRPHSTRARHCRRQVCRLRFPPNQW